MNTKFARVTTVLIGLITTIMIAKMRGEDSADSIATLEQQIQALDKKVKLLEQEQKEDGPVAHSNSTPKPEAQLTVNEKGVEFESADKNFDIHLHGLLDVDTHLFMSPDSGPATTSTSKGQANNNTGDSGFYLRRARPIITGTFFKEFEFNITPDFGATPNGTSGLAGSGTVVIDDAWINAHLWDEFQVQVGRFKGPFGLERSQPSGKLSFIEAGLPQSLTPQYDHGVLLKGKVSDGFLNYAVGVVNGQNDNASASTQLDSSFDVVDDFTIHPFKKLDIKELQGFSVGIGTTIGNHGTGPASATTAANTTSYYTPAQQTWFSYSAPSGTSGGTVIDGQVFRISPHASYYNGPYSLWGEYISSNAAISRFTGGPGGGLQQAHINNRSWQVVSTYVITGEDASYYGVVPREDFSLKNHTWGAFEIAARYGELSLDDALFRTLPGAPATVAGGAPTNTFAAAGPSDARSFGFGLNWYLNRDVTANFGIDETDFYGGNLRRETETVFSSRLQVNF